MSILSKSLTGVSISDSLGILNSEALFLIIGNTVGSSVILTEVINSCDKIILWLFLSILDLPCGFHRNPLSGFSTCFEVVLSTPSSHKELNLLLLTSSRIFFRIVIGFKSGIFICEERWGEIDLGSFLFVNILNNSDCFAIRLNSFLCLADFNRMCSRAMILLGPGASHLSIVSWITLRNKLTSFSLLVSLLDKLIFPGFLHLMFLDRARATNFLKVTLFSFGKLSMLTIDDSGYLLWLNSLSFFLILLHLRGWPNSAFGMLREFNTMSILWLVGKAAFGAALQLFWIVRFFGAALLLNSDPFRFLDFFDIDNFFIDLDRNAKWRIDERV